MTYGNGLVETSTYNNRLQPTQLRTYNSTTNADVLNLTYGFTNSAGVNNGNVVTFNSTATQIFMRTYTYDELNRLSTMSSPADASGCYGLTWTYDAWGNRLSQNPAGGSGSACVGSQPTIYTNNRIIDPGYVHDTAGNMTHDASHGYTFNAESELTQVDSGSTATYVYDAIGQRVRKTASGVTTDYVRDASAHVVAEIQGSTWTKGYVYVGPLLLSQYDGLLGSSGATTLFVHTDHLGTTRLLSTSAASVSDSMDYLPYGELLSGGSSTTHKFTGKERDAESGLDNFEARYFSSSLGRFGSPDPLLNSGRPDNPQSWNRYTYTLNNPLNFTDPTGLYVWSAGLGGNAADGAVSADILDKRKHFRSALGDAFLDADSLNDFDQWADAIMALNSYGTEGQANGVTVAIDTVPGDSGAFTHVEADNQIVVAITPGSFRAGDLEAIVGHEGKHVEDAKTWLGCGRCAAKNPSTFDEETAGYEIGGLIAAGHFNRMNMNATYSVNAGPVGQRQRIPVWNSSWGMVDFSRGLIKQAAQNVVKANGEGPDTAAGKRPAFPGAAGQWQ